MLLGCAIAALSAAPAAAALETIVQDDAAMLYSDPAGAQAAAQRLQGLGVDRVRITANWSVLTRDASSKVRPHFDARDPAAYEQARWANLDNAVRAIRAAGLTVLIDIGFWAPHWATSSPPGPKARANVKPKDYANFAVALVRRYSGKFAVPSGTPAPPPPPAEDENPFKTLLMPLFPSLGNTDPPPVVVAPQPDPLPRVSVFALWNEPNFPGLLLPQWKTDKRTPASPRVYRRMVLAAYPAIKKARSGTRVLVGNTSSVGGNPGTGAVAPLAFIRGFACVDSRLRPRTTGECAHFHRIPGDGWAHHPYTRNQPPRARGPKPDDVQIVDLPKLARTLSELVRRGRLAAGYRRIYLTEFGFETKRVGTRPRVSQAAQGRWLTWSEYLADRVPAVKSFAQFLLRDQPPADKVVSNSDARAHGEYSTGLLTADGTPKTAARTFRAGLFAALGSGGRRVMLYGRLRLGPGKKAITLQRRAGAGAWTTIDRFELDGQGAFQRTFANRGDAIYRLTFPGQAGVRKNGLAVRPVSRPR
jgi:hypothetical protein